MRVSTGTNTSSIVRSSAFNLYVRKAGLDANGESFEFQRMEPFFVVVGRRPVSQYNFIQVRHPVQEELEYKLVPLPGAELRAVSDNQEFIQLSAASADRPNASKEVAKQQKGVSLLDTLIRASIDVLEKALKFGEKITLSNTLLSR